MAEPARRFEPQTGREPGHGQSRPRPELRPIEGGGETSSPSGDLHGLPSLKDQEETGASPAGEAPASPKPDLKALEGGGETSSPGRSWYSGSKDQPGKGILRGRFSRRQKIVGAVGGGIIASIIAFMVFFLPALRLESYLSSIDNRVFAGVSNAIEKRLERLTGYYLISTLERCGNRVTVGCRGNYATAGIAKSLFNAWRDFRLEEKL
ncbi:hypothetical protein HY380_00255, partial [Candidatus Saccharibacteria bacterium]|nr:hypothetical protein [Candidatus Saccharibacteria bacterium]